MTSTEFFSSLIFAWTALYVVGPAWLIIRGYPLTAGCVQLVGALLPGIWQEVFWPNEAGNFGLLMVMMVPIPLCIIIVGAILNANQLIGWLRNKAARRK